MCFSFILSYKRFQVKNLQNLLVVTKNGYDQLFINEVLD